MAATSTRSHFSSAGMTFACAKLDVLSIPHLTLFISFTFHGVIVFHFPFSILHLSFAIAGTAQRAQWQMTNVIWKMENVSKSSPVCLCHFTNGFQPSFQS